ncbi:MAG: hypothetical protein NXI00_17370 [Cytophagales bacterium]|nr:hypothetical protein [Cytophagales bacterium]
MEYNLDFTSLWIFFKKNSLIVFFSGILGAIGIFIFSLRQPNEYQSSVSVMPEIETNSLTGGIGQFAGLADLAGVDLSSMGSNEAIRPDLYPNIINNNSFFIFLLEQRVKTFSGDSIVFEDFIKSNYDLEESISKKSILDYFITDKIEISDSLPDDIIYISELKGEIIEKLQKKINAEMDKKTGIVTISVELPDPVISAYVAKLSMDYLTDFVIQYRTDKAKKDLEFLETQIESAKIVYYKNQRSRASYADQIPESAIRFKSADVERERIESSYKVTFNFYNQLIQQYETAKMKVQEKTPVFKTLGMPIVPYKKSGPHRLIMSIGGFVFFSGVSIIILALFNFKSFVKSKVHL